MVIILKQVQFEEATNCHICREFFKEPTKKKKRKEQENETKEEKSEFDMITDAVIGTYCEPIEEK